MLCAFASIVGYISPRIGERKEKKKNNREGGKKKRKKEKEKRIRAIRTTTCASAPAQENEKTGEGYKKTRWAYWGSCPG